MDGPAGTRTQKIQIFRKQINDIHYNFVVSWILIINSISPNLSFKYFSLDKP